MTDTKLDLSALGTDTAAGDPEKGTDGHGYATSLSSDNLSYGKEEVFTLESLDPALNAKMHLVNNVRLSRRFVCCLE